MCRPRLDRSPVPAYERASALSPSLLDTGANISVANERHVLDLLKAHYAYQRPRLLVAPERNPLIDFMLQFLAGHVRFCPTIRRDDSFVSLRSIVDDAPNEFKVRVVTATDHVFSSPRAPIHAGLVTPRF